MIVKWLHHRAESSQVIVFFSGWGFDETVVSHLSTNSDTDVLFVSDYSSLDISIPDLTNYKHRSLVAWSFGVGNYSVWQDQNNDIDFDRRIAINGTTQAIDRKLGIAGKVVQHTVDQLSAKTLQEFVKRSGGSSPSNIKGESDSQINAKRAELELIKQRDYPRKTNVVWDKVFISQNDHIFPTENQLRAWLDTPQTLIDAPHNPFDIWSDWQDLLA